MTSEAKIAANRRNAERSTGPRTSEGKARSGANAIGHGLTAERVLVPGESPEEFAVFCQEYRAQLEPVGALEATLVAEIIGDSWRLCRVPWIEAGVLRRQMEDALLRPLRPIEILSKAIGCTPVPRETLEARRGPDDLGLAFKAIDEESGFITERLDRHQGRLAKRRERNIALLLQVQARRQQAETRAVPSAGAEAEAAGVPERPDGAADHDHDASDAVDAAPPEADGPPLDLTAAPPSINSEPDANVLLELGGQPAADHAARHEAGDAQVAEADEQQNEPTAAPPSIPSASEPAAEATAS